MARRGSDPAHPGTARPAPDAGWSRRQVLTGSLLVTGSVAAGWFGRDVLDARVRLATTPPPSWPTALAAGIRASKVPPPVAARVIAATAIAADVARSGAWRSTSMTSSAQVLARLTSAPPPSLRAGVDPDLAMSAAATATARALLGPAGTPAVTAAHVEASRRARADDPALRHGADVALWLLAAIRADGYPGRLTSASYAADPLPGTWRPQPGTAALEPGWGALRTLALPSASACAPPPPPEFSTDASSQLYRDAAAVLGATPSDPLGRSAATWWADGTGTSPTPAGHWLLLAADTAADQGMSADQTGRLLAWLGIAMHDSFVSCWQCKYEHRLLRPDAYITAYLDADWTPLLPTPAFPEYTSGHSTCSFAAATVLTQEFGGVPVLDRVGGGGTQGIRQFASFEAAATDAAWSRLDGGIHFPCGIQDGTAQGREVGDVVIGRRRELEV